MIFCFARLPFTQMGMLEMQDKDLRLDWSLGSLSLEMESLMLSEADQMQDEWAVVTYIAVMWC